MFEMNDSQCRNLSSIRPFDEGNPFFYKCNTEHPGSERFRFLFEAAFDPKESPRAGRHTLPK